MARPRKSRMVSCLPVNTEFLPAKPGSPEAVILTVDEYEAIRLIDSEHFSQEKCAEAMEVARTTVQQIYDSARKKIARALVYGRAIKIEGGEYRLCGGAKPCRGCAGCRRRNGSCPADRERRKSMKIAIPVDENKKDICVSFGRTPFFLIHDAQTNTTAYIANPAAEAAGGAGLKAAQAVVDQEADILITVRCGENAAEVLKAAEIAIYKSEGTDAEENIRAFKEGRLAELTHFHAGYQGIR